MSYMLICIYDCSAARSASRAFRKPFSIDRVSGFALPITRRAIRAVSSSVITASRTSSSVASGSVRAFLDRDRDARELSEKNRRRLEREFAKELQDGALTISGRGVAEPLPLNDASVDIIYGLHGFHCMESFDVVHAEMMRLLRRGGRLVWATSVARATDDGSRVVAGAMRAAGFVDVKIDVTRLQGAARWTPVVATKPTVE